MKWHLKSKRTLTGKRLVRSRKKKKFERGSIFLETRIGRTNIKVQRGLGGNVKLKVLSDGKVNVADPKTKKVKSSKLVSVDKNPANIHYVRRNIITKGAIVKTEAGLVKITSRPGQDGTLNGILVEEKK